MSKILLADSEFPVITSPTIARKLGMASATVLQKLHYFLTEKDYAKKEQGGKSYWYHTYENWTTTIGFYAVATIKRAVRKLKELGLIEVEKLADHKHIRTNYYTINYKRLKEKLGIDLISSSKPKEPKKEQKPHKTPFEDTCSIGNTEEVGKNVGASGTADPHYAQADKEQLATMQENHRRIYSELRRLKVDIAPNDPRLSYWSVKSKEVVMYAASASDRLNLYRWQWHTPEIIFPEHLLQVSKSHDSGTYCNP